MKKVFFFTVLVLVCGVVFAQERAQRLFVNGVNVSLIDNGMALRFENANNTDGRYNVDIVIYYENGTSRLGSYEIHRRLTIRGNDREGFRWVRETGSTTARLSSRATAISLPTAAQATTLRNQREAAERSERERREAAERAAAAERAQREAAERSERERREAAERAAERAAATEAAERAAVPTYMENGTAAFNRSDWDRAIAEFTRVIRIDPRYAMAYNNRGAAYNGKSDWDRAIADFTEAIRLDPNYAAPYRHRAYAYMQKGNYTQARNDVNRALQINPNYQNARELSAELQRRGY